MPCESRLKAIAVTITGLLLVFFDNLRSSNCIGALSFLNSRKAIARAINGLLLVLTIR